MSSMMALFLGLTLAAYAPQRMGTQMLAPEQEARVQVLAKNLRCAVCQGVSIADSPASMARAQLEKVRELVAQGKTDQEINEYFVARYGEWVLLTPPATGVNLAVWLAPVALLAVGFWLISAQVRRGRKTPLKAPVLEPTSEDDEYLKRVRAELEK